MTGPAAVGALSPLRRAIAARMVDAKQQIPHFRVAVDVELDPLVRMRRDHNRRWSTGVSLNDCFIAACAHVLIARPRFNVQLIDGKLHQFEQADISFVVAMPGGLSTPVIREAERRSIDGIADETRRLSELARRGALKLADIQGGAFTISNLGATGVVAFDAIINPPQCAILAIASAMPVLLPCPAAGMRTAQLVRMTLSADHRVIDGVDAAAFLQDLKQRLEDPAALFAHPPDA
jgi:pyruvate dehydrogenase E2 component (dihydrolipoamide acetyltransferase)